MTEKQPRLTIQVTEDKTSATISFLPESGVNGSLTLSLEQLTLLITALGNVRARMVVGQPIPPLEGQLINGVFNTKWYVQAEPVMDGSSLAFAHPAYGPVSFVVPRDQVAKIVRLLSLQVALPALQDTMPN